MALDDLLGLRQLVPGDDGEQGRVRAKALVGLDGQLDRVRARRVAALADQLQPVRDLAEREVELLDLLVDGAEDCFVLAYPRASFFFMCTQGASSSATSPARPRFSTTAKDPIVPTISESGS